MTVHLGSVLAKVLIAVLLFAVVVAAAEKTYYEILQVSPDASLTEIKARYRQLALLHHPDRNKGNEKQAEVIFREISEAYEVLSDEKGRQDYDYTLKYGGRQHEQFQRQWQRNSRHRDPFAQFNDLFQNDEFFKEAFKGMDDLFTQMFEGADSNYQKNSKGTNGGGWASNLLNRFTPGFNIEVTTSSSSGGGGGSARATSRSYGSGGGSGGSSSYTSRSTRTVIENGKRVTIQSLEKDGNKIQEKYIGEQLVERLINGKPDEKLIEASDEF